MGREIKRVPLDFGFPLGKSYADHMWDAHKAECTLDDHDDCVDISGNPPSGDGWQLWQTVSDGPISPVFKTSGELIDYMCRPCEPGDTPGWDRGWNREVATHFVLEVGWAPSMVSGYDIGLIDGATFAYIMRDKS